MGFTKALLFFEQAKAINLNEDADQPPIVVKM